MVEVSAVCRGALRSCCPEFVIICEICPKITYMFQAEMRGLMRKQLCFVRTVKVAQHGVGGGYV